MDNKEELLDMIKVLETSACKNSFNSKTILNDVKYDSFIFVLNKLKEYIVSKEKRER